MKQLSVLLLFVGLWSACSETAKTPPTPPVAVNTMAADSAAIAQTIHGFYTWYDTFSVSQADKFNFIEPVGQHLKVNQSKLEAYFAYFKKNGFVCDEFVAREYAFYKKCEPLWQNEPLDEVPSCLDADKYFCAQDWELDFWVKSPVRIKSLGENKMAATLYGTEAGSPQERNFEMVKEAGKWLILSIECDMGVK